jgi:PAS domain S-box-containing protein
MVFKEGLSQKSPRPRMPMISKTEGVNADSATTALPLQPAGGGGPVPGGDAELVMLNAELQATVQELNLAYSDMENLLASSEIATIFLDRSLRIMRFTPAMAPIFNLCRADIGRPFLEVAGKVDGSLFASDAETVLERLDPVERELAIEGGGHYLKRVLPYRGSQGNIEGIVVTMVDLTERKRMEDALLLAKEQWERTFDSVPDLIAILDNEHRIVRANRAMTERLGLTHDACRDKICYHCVHGSALPPELCPHSQTMKDGGEHAVEVYAERLQGDFLVTTSPLRDEQGRLIGSVHVARDIGDRKRAEQELRKSKEQVEQHLAQLQAIVDNLNDGVVIAEPDGAILHLNPAAVAMHGFEDLEQCRGALDDFGSIFELSTAEAGVLPVGEWPLARILRGEPMRDYEVSIRRRETEWTRVFSYGGSLVRGKEGEPLLAVVSLTDVTERHRAEESLRQSELQFRTLADAIPQLCWMANADGWIFWYNQRLYEYTGTSAEQMQGWGWQSVHDPEMLPSILERWRHTLESGEPFEMTFPLRGADGEFRPFLTRVLPLRDQNGRIVRWFGTNTDIAEQRKTELALKHSNLRLNLLAETAGALLATDSPQEVVNSICRKVMQFLDCDAFFNFLVAVEGERLQLNACAGIPEEEAQRIEWLDFGGAVCGCAARDACRIVVDGIESSDDPRVELVKSYGIRAYACHPLLAQGRVLGTLSFGTRKKSSFAAEELALMNGIADLVAIAMQRKLMEESIRQSEAMLEAFFDASPGILSIEDEQFRYIKTDRLTPTYYGLDRKSIVGRGAATLAPELMENYGEMMRRVMETGEPALNREVSHPVPGRPGQMSYWLASYFPVPLPGNKRGIGLMGVDITDKKRAEEALRRAHDELEKRVQERTEELAETVKTLQGEITERERAEATLIRLNRLYVVLSEIDQAIVRASGPEAVFRDFCRIAVEHGGFLLAFVGVVDEGSSRMRVVASSGATAYLDAISISSKEEPEGGGPTGISLREGTYYICNDFQSDPCTRPWHEKGKSFGIGASASIAIKEEGRVVGALTLYAAERNFFDQQHVALLRQMGADISFALDNYLRESRRGDAERALQRENLERLQAVEALREKERLLIQQSRQAALGEMIGNIAHQWRQPLNTLGLMVQELSLCYEYGDFDKNYLEKTVQGVMQLVHHMSQTIDDFRNFFKPEKEKVDFRARKVLDKAVSIIEASLKENGIRLSLSASCDPLVNGYPNEYSQVILNILLNARDAFAERAVEQPLIAVKLAEAAGVTVVTINDNAGGIPEQIMESIFDPYFTTKAPDKGTGVGLYMSKVIIEKNMNGRLTACNRDGGAEFRIEV